QVNRHGERFVESDYWSGHMMAEFAAELASDRAPVYLKLSHLPEETIGAVETILHSTERPTRGTFHANRGHDYRTHDIEMHISEIGLCGGHSASGVRVDAHARTTVPRLYAAGDLACVPHNYMIGAFVYGDLAGEDAARYRAYEGELDRAQLEAAHALVYRPLLHPDGPPQPQVEYKLRRFVNDYVAPPKSGAKLSLAVEAFTRMEREIAGMGGRTPHELMRCAEVSFIRDCAEMAARASLARTESRWGLYHERLDHPEQDDAEWLYHLDLRRSASGAMEFTARPVEPYAVPVPEFAPPAGPERPLGEVALVPVATAGPREAPPSARAVAEPAPAAGPAAAAGPSPRLLRLLALVEESPELPALEPYLTDAEPEVRAAAVAALAETVPAGTGPALAARLRDGDAAVRSAAAGALRELAEVLDADGGLGAGLRAALDVPDPAVRAVAVEVLRARGLGDAGTYAAALADTATEVRLQAVRALVSVDAVGALAGAVADPAREVRVAVARGLAAVSAPEPGPLVPLLGDADPLVRGAAFGALASAGCPAPLAERAVAALDDPAWQVRAGAAAALRAAGAERAVPALAKGLADPNADVRKAAVLALLGHAPAPEARAALATAAADPDADVRAYAARGLAPAAP
ncbi:HEAT repeat domain-containing protein, partial [Streptomyces sp. NPDC058757]